MLHIRVRTFPFRNRYSTLPRPGSTTRRTPYPHGQILVNQREPTTMLKGGIVALTHKNADQTPPFYQLVDKLFDEACLLPVQRKLVSEGKK